MTDTQWPRFMVFQQEAPGQPLVHNGSVHAPDIELAMLNARDVFARRPEAVAMWVVPADAIFTKTREELAAAQSGEATDQSVDPLIEYYVFAKLSEQGQASELGSVQAGSKEAAIEAARQQFAGRGVLRWYVFPAAAVFKSEPSEADPMFAPARDKTYKDQAEYPVVTMMRELRSKRKLDSE